MQGPEWGMNCRPSAPGIHRVNPLTVNGPLPGSVFEMRGLFLTQSQFKDAFFRKKRVCAGNIHQMFQSRNGRFHSPDWPGATRHQGAADSASNGRSSRIDIGESRSDKGPVPARRPLAVFRFRRPGPFVTPGPFVMAGPFVTPGAGVHDENRSVGK